MLPLVLAAGLFTPHDAAALATVDMASVPAHELPFTRYVWVRTGDQADARIGSFVANWLSQENIKPVATLGGGKVPLLLRLNLRDYYSDANLARALRTWEKLEYDPSFNTLYTFDTVQLLLKRGTKPEWLAGVSTVFNRIKVKTSRGEEQVAVFRQPHVDIDSLAFNLRTNAPIVELDYFVIRALSSIQNDPGAKDQEVFKTILGGLYYEFAGIRTAKDAGKKKATDFEVLLEDLGIIDDADFYNAQAKWDRLGSERRIAMRFSRVTGKKRVVCFVPTAVDLQSVLTFTLDPNDGSVDILSNPFMNLLAFRGDAVEAIYEREGRQVYALFNKAGALQFEVPPQIANDTTVKEPYTQRLQTISCITCHAGPKGDNGWQPLTNDAKAILPRVVADVSTGMTEDNVRLIKRKYTYDPEFILGDLRRRTIGAVLQCTGQWPKAGDQTGVYRLVADQIILIRERFWYTQLDAAAVLKELGYDPGKVDPAKYLQAHAAIPGPFEDERIATLVDGHKISRADATLAKGFIASRLELSLKQR